MWMKENRSCAMIGISISFTSLTLATSTHKKKTLLATLTAFGKSDFSICFLFQWRCFFLYRRGSICGRRQLPGRCFTHDKVELC